MAQACSQNLRLPGIVSVNLDNAFQQQQTVLTDVVETSKEGADERSARLGGEYRLRRRETERDIYFNAFVGKLTRSFQSIARERAFDDYVRSDLRILTSFTNHAVFVRARHFRRDGSLNDLADGADVLFEVNASFLCDQGRVGCYAIGET